MKNLFTILLLVLISVSSCKKNTPNIDGDTDVIGYNILEKVPGIWNGPVNSPTSIGSFPIWIVDFRPISSNQVSAKNELDSINDIFMSFFIVKHDEKYKVAFRNGGGFAGNVRNSYMLIDSVKETTAFSFYRFSDPVSGGNRVYTDVTFKQDSLIMHTYTNKFNTLSTPVTHMNWRAKLVDKTSTQDAISLFSFPKKEITKDFTSTFDGLSDACFYSTATDPFPENEQPYLGVSTVNISISSPAVVDASKKVLISITTEPLFNGFIFQVQNLNFRSRYVFVNAANSASFNFNYMHPGTYYVNAIYDVNGDYNFSSGDYMNSAFDQTLTLEDKGTASTNVNINFQIP